MKREKNHITLDGNTYHYFVSKWPTVTHKKESLKSKKHVDRTKPNVSMALTDKTINNIMK